MRDLVELGLKKSEPTLSQASDTGALSMAVDRLLATLAQLAGSVLEAEPDVTSTFITRLDACRRVLRDPASGRSTAEALDTAIRSIEHFIKSSGRYVAAREAELTEMIRILHEAARLMAGQSSNFNEELLETSEKLHKVIQLDDIRELKRHLSAEVATLRLAVEEKQRRDAESAASLSNRLEELQTQLVKAEEEASLDPLTKIANRGTFDQVFARMIANARATKMPLSVAMVDIDGFKSINDTHGHQIGDRVLLCAAMWLGKGLRHTDFLARYGGEEFAVILKDARLTEIHTRMTQVLAEIASRSFEYGEAGKTRTVQFTASAGVAELAPSESAEQFLRRADEALYAAKRAGRNLVVSKKRSLLSGLIG
jgi:diguanylate cyclase